jgi:myo-inositol 2-dehydrogenase/D-chiro-inositol 1-dehydrogenase
MAVIDNSRQAVYGYDQRVEAFGSAGAASSENPNAHAGVIRTARETRSSNLLSFFVQRYLPSYAAGWGAFVEAIRDGAPSPVPGSDGRASLVIGLAAARSLAEGGPVRVAAIG